MRTNASLLGAGSNASVSASIAALNSAGTSTNQTSIHRWAVDNRGKIVNFDLKTLRNDLLFRLQSGNNLYTLEECRTLILEMTAVATKWQEQELAQILYLAEVHQKVLPGRQLVYQFPPCAAPSIPFCASVPQVQDSPLFRITKVVEELNRTMIRMIDDLWARRRERLLFAARLLKDLEGALSGGTDSSE